MGDRAAEIIAECKRQEESCLYTSTALFEWMKEVRVYRVAFIVLPIICGGFASARILVGDPSFDWLVAGCALLAGLFPAIFKALDLDVSIKSISDSAHRFKVLQDRFRQTAAISSLESIEKLGEDFIALMERMDDARAASPPAPERHFKKARKKILEGNYEFSADKQA